MADEDIREGSPKKAKKKAPPPDEEDDDRPRKKKRDADAEDEEEAPRKKKKRMDEDEDESDLGASPLSAIIPVGGSVFGLLALWLSVVALVLGIAGFVFLKDLKVIAVIMPSLWPISLLCGVLAFFTHKHKASYGSIAGNIRAIIGILISLGVMVMHAVLVFMFFKGG